MSKKGKGKFHIAVVQPTVAPVAEPVTETVSAENVSVAPAENVSVPAPKVIKPRYVSGRFAPTQIIRLKVAGNPKRQTGASYGRFALHKDGQTVADYVQACVDAGWKAAKAHDDVRWDAAHGFIEVEAPAPKAE